MIRKRAASNGPSLGRKRPKRACGTAKRYRNFFYAALHQSSTDRLSLDLGPIVGENSRFGRGPKSAFDCERLPPRRRDPDLANLDQRVASYDYSPLGCRKPRADQTREHPPAEAMAMNKHFLRSAMRTAGQQIQRPALLRAESAFART